MTTKTKKPLSPAQKRRRLQAKLRSEMTYVVSIPKVVPPGQILVHNRVRPSRLSGNRGSRFWLSPRGTRGYAICTCGWAPELPRHYRVDDGPLPTRVEQEAAMKAHRARRRAQLKAQRKKKADAGRRSR